MSIPVPTRRVHECDLPYPYLFVDELPGYTPPGPDTIEHELELRGKSIAIDNPRYQDGFLVKCPECKTWWVFRTHATPPGDYLGMVQCITTYKPAWHLVRWRDFGLRRTIRDAEANNEVGRFPTVDNAPDLKAPRFL